MHELLQKLPIAARAVAPNVNQEPIRRHGAARMREEQLQEARFERREPHRAAREPQEHELGDVERQRPDGDGVVASAPARRSSALTRASKIFGLNGLLR